MNDLNDSGVRGVFGAGFLASPTTGRIPCDGFCAASIGNGSISRGFWPRFKSCIAHFPLLSRGFPFFGYHAEMAEEPTSQPCPSCGYDLRGLSGSRCPKCGVAFERVEHLELVDPRRFTRKAILWRAGLPGAAILAILPFSVILTAVTHTSIFFAPLYPLVLIYWATNWLFRAVTARSPMVQSSPSFLFILVIYGLWYLMISAHWRRVRNRLEQSVDQSRLFRRIAIATILISDIGVLVAVSQLGAWVVSQLVID